MTDECLIIPRECRRHRQPAAAPVESFTVTPGADPVNRWVEISGPGRGMRLLRDGAHDFLNIAELVKTVVPPGLTDREKALAVYRFCMRHTYSFPMGWGEYDMNRFINAYGYSFCWGQADFQHLLMEAAGLRARAPQLKGHSSCEVFLDGAWRALDSYIRLMAPSPDLGSLASGRDLHEHPELFRALFPPDRAATFGDYWAQYGPGGTYEPRHDSHAMMLTLRRGERLRLHHANRGHWCVAPREPSDYVNGDWVYAPVLDAGHLARETESAVNVVSKSGTIRAADAGQPAALEYRVHCPYPLVTGRLRLDFAGTGTVQVAVSTDRRHTWHDLWVGRAGRRSLVLDPHLSVRTVPTGTAPATLAREAVHEVIVRLRWHGRAVLSRVNMAFVCQAHVPTMPRLEPGINRWRLIGGEPGAAVELAWDEYPGAGVSDASPLEGERVTLHAAVHNPGRTPARRVPVRFVEAATGAVVASATIPSIPPGKTRSVSRRWVAAAHGDRPGTSLDDRGKVYASTRIRIEAGPPRGPGGETGEIGLVVRDRPEPRFSDALLRVGRDRSRGEDHLVIRAAIANCAPDARGDRLYVCDAPFMAEVSPFLGHPDRGGVRLGPARRLADIQPGEFAVAEWRLDPGALPAEGALWVEALCDASVAPGKRRILGTTALRPDLAAGAPQGR